MTEGERAALLTEVVAEVARLCDIIDATSDLTPTANPASRYEIRIEVEFGRDGVAGHHYVLWTRHGGMSWHTVEALVEQRDAFLFDVFELITHEMACNAVHLTTSLANLERASAQEALMRRLNGEWGDAFAERRRLEQSSEY